MPIAEKPGKEVTITTANDERRTRGVRILTIILGILTGLASLALLFLGVKEPAWQLRTLTLVYAAFTCGSILTSYVLFPHQRISLGLGVIVLSLGIILVVTSALLTGLGFPAAIVFLIFSLVVSASVTKAWQADLAMAIGILVSGICALLTDFSPFPQLTIPLVEILTPAILVSLVVIYLVMVAKQFVPSTLRLRLVSIILAIGLIPLTLLPLIQSRLMTNVWNEKMNQSLLRSAQQTAIGIDQFIQDEQSRVTNAAQNESLSSNQRKLTTLTTVLVAVVVGFLAIAAARLLSQPILHLTTTACQISEGDLGAQAPVHSSDEFGRIGAAFNSLTSQMRLLINQLEERVQSRTQEIASQNEALSRRVHQLETVAEVARQIDSTQELEALLASISQLISEQFGFYHIGIFLLDDNHEFAVLRAANSEGGQRLLARRHMLPVGEVGIVGYTTGTGEARIATEVGQDSILLDNPDLPLTRSEIALPLMVGDTIIGALDIQSVEPDAFHPEDIDLFKTLADQVAIAIHNNQLYADTLRALKEAEHLHRQYLRSEWAEDTGQRKVLGYVYNQSGISPQKTENPMWHKVFSTGEPVYAVLPGSNGSTDKAVMAIPITIRGETIGVIQVQDQKEDRLWSADEISVANSIASQVADALENARLFENTVRRAEREKKVLQITAKIRSTNDPEEMMKIAVSELQQVLRATRTQIYIRQTNVETGQETDQDEGTSIHK